MRNLIGLIVGISTLGLLSGCPAPTSETCGDPAMNVVCPANFFCVPGTGRKDEAGDSLPDSPSCMPIAAGAESFCGNKVPEDGEECDDGNLENNDGCSQDCSLPHCGDGIAQLREVTVTKNDGSTFLYKEECDGGRDPNNSNENEALSTKECDYDCTLPSCGDRTLNPALESCDPGPTCANEKQCESDDDCKNLAVEDKTCKKRTTECCTVDCQPSKCGNNILDPKCDNLNIVDEPVDAERCDTGSRCADGTACTEQAQCAAVTVSGSNGAPDTDCKPRDSDDDHCNSKCNSREVCGDGVKNDELPGDRKEACDDGQECANSVPCYCDPFGEQDCDDFDDCRKSILGTPGEDPKPILDTKGKVLDLADYSCRTRDNTEYNAELGVYVKYRDTRCDRECKSQERCGDKAVDPHVTYLNGVAKPPEVCDLGTKDIGDPNDEIYNEKGRGCAFDCLSAEVCGDGWVNNVPHYARNPEHDPNGAILLNAPLLDAETCDDANRTAGDGCSRDCVVETGWDCGSDDANSICTEIPGDNLIVGQERCDDGNTVDGDGCTSKGVIEPGWECLPSLPEDVDVTTALEAGPCSPICGDRQIVGAEADLGGCDDGNKASGDGCSETCKAEIGWKCENALGIAGRCTPHCGDGLVTSELYVDGSIKATPETCDDGPEGHLKSGDGCDINCRIETGWECPGQDAVDGFAFQTGGDCAPKCGDSLVRGVDDEAETCDDGGREGNDGCDANCRVEPFWLCPTTNGVGGSCAAVCGDNVVVIGKEDEPQERCDDGLTDGKLQRGDGCDTTCRTEPGWVCPGDPTPVLGSAPAPDADPTSNPGGACRPYCGDAELRGKGELKETCDEGEGVTPTGGCAACQKLDGWFCPEAGGICRPQCGDGKLRGFDIEVPASELEEGATGTVIRSQRETCDDANLVANDGCSASCRIEDGWSCDSSAGASACSPVCGDGKIRGAETCDEGALGATGGCVDCRTQVGWLCAAPATDGVGTVCSPRCGDGKVFGDETCDDGNEISDDGCASTCRTVEDGWACTRETGLRSVCSPICGDAKVYGDETCDDGNEADDDGCDSNCRLVEDGWSCSRATGQRSTCNPICGDGKNYGLEICDDGNQIGDDGCSANCRVVESGWTCTRVTGARSTCSPICGDGKSLGLESCDDGNLLASDGCSSVCQRPGAVAGCSTLCTVETGWTCERSATAPGACDNICGDTLVVGNEQCDLGSALNSNTGDCTLLCRNATCSDGLLRSSTLVIGGPVETDVDCGTGPDSASGCAPCKLTKRCIDDNDCESHYCELSTGRCELPARTQDSYEIKTGNGTSPAVLTIPIADLLENDESQNLDTISVSNATTPPALPRCGQVSYDSGTRLVTFDYRAGATPCVPPSPTPPTPFETDFDYRICPPAPFAGVDALCTKGLVKVKLNRDPDLTVVSGCVSLGSASTSLNVLSGFKDPDGDDVGNVTVQYEFPAGIAAAFPGTIVVSGGVVTISPTNPNVAATYRFAIKACDDVETAPGCIENKIWEPNWSEAPALEAYTDAQAIAVPKGQVVATVVPATAPSRPRVVVSSGAVLLTAAASAFPSGPFQTNVAVTSQLGGTCTYSDPNAGLPGDETLRYVPPANTTGMDSCYVQACQECAGSARICSVTRIPFAVVEQPNAADDTVAGTEVAGSRSTATFTRDALINNDSRFSLATFALTSDTSSITTSCSGTVDLVGTNLTYTGPVSPSGGCLLNDTFTYKVCNELVATLCDNATVTIAINRFPVATNDTKTATEDTALTFLASTLTTNDSDPNGDALTVTSVQSPTGGTVSLSGGNVTFTPTADSTTSGSFTYTIADPKGLTATATATVNVTSVNDAPSGTDATLTTNEDTFRNFTAADFGFSDPADGNTLQSVTIVTLPAARDGSLTLSGNAVTVSQSVTLANIPNLRFTPAADVNGTGLGAFTFKVRDNGGTANGGIDLDPTANTIVFDITAVNDEPAISPTNPTRSVVENNASVLTMTATDKDAPTQTLTFSLSGADAPDFDIDPATGVLTFKTAPNFEAGTGSEDSGKRYVVTVTVTDDGDPALSRSTTVTVNVTNINEGPVPLPKAATTNEDTSVFIHIDTLTAGASDPDAGDTITIVGVSNPVNGVVSFKNSGNATLRGATFVPDTDFSGEASFDFSIKDASNVVGTATVTITVTAVNDAPVLTTTATPVFGSMTEDDAAPVGAVGTLVSSLVDSGGALDNVADVDGPLTGLAIITASAANGSWHFSTNGGTTWTALGAVSASNARLLAADANTRIYFQPNANFNGTVTSAVSFRAWDGSAGTTNGQLTAITSGASAPFSADLDTFDVTVTAVNDAPTFTSSATASVAENTSAVTTVTATDVENHGLTFSKVGGADQAAFNLDSGTGALTFVASPNFEAPTDADTNNTYVVTVRVTDNGTPNRTTDQTITVTVTNVAEGGPVITSGNSATVAENTATNVNIYTATGTNSAGGAITWGLTGGDATSFTINSSNGNIRFVTSPNFESKTSFTFNLTATDRDSQVTTLAITVSITDVDEFNVGAVTDSDATANAVDENSAAGTVVHVTASASDADGSNNTITYSLTTNPGGLFAIDASTGVVTTAAIIDREAVGVGASVSITVRADSSDGSSSSQSFTITINDANDAPVITSSSSASVAENATAVLTVTATDQDSTQSRTFSISGGADQAKFSITSGGVLTFASAPDFETKTDADENNTYIVEVTATDNGAPVRSASQTITVTVTDVNEAPSITSSNAVSVAENTTAVLTVTGSDPDASQSLTFSITGGADQAKFSISGGVLTFASAPDFETRTDADTNNTYIVQVRATDNGAPVQFATQTITVTVTDANDAPVFTSSASVSVAENQTAVTTVAASDQDVGQTRSFAITGGDDSAKFSITEGGVLTFQTAPNFEAPTDTGANNTYVVEVTATDNGTPARSASQTITVTVTNVAESGPSITSATSVTVDENTLTNVDIYDPTGTVSGGPLTWSKSGGDAASFVFTAQSRLRFVSAPDFETKSSYSFTLTLTDRDNQTASITLTINIQDLDEFNVGAVTDSNGATNEVTENVAVGTTVGLTASASDADGTTNAITYTLSSNPGSLFAINATSGVVTTNAAIDREALSATASITVLATSADGSTSSQSFTININDANDAPVITSDSTASAAENQTAVMTVTATDQDTTQSRTFTITGGDDSAKFSITEGGVLTFQTAPNFEVPTDTGANNTYVVEVTATDNGTPTRSASQTITVTVTNVAESGPSITSAATASVAENSPSNTTVYTATGTSGAPGALKWSISGADSTSFSIAQNTGVLTVSAAASLDFESKASYAFTLTVEDSNKATTSTSLTVNLTDVDEFNVGAVTDSNSATNQVTENVAVGTTVGLTASASDADGSLNTITYSLSSNPGTLFAIDSGTGVVTTAAAINREALSPSVSITVLATSADGSTSSQSFNIAIIDANDAPVITSSATTSAAENQTAVMTLTATDEDGESLTFGKAVGQVGRDDAKFTITSGGVLTFATAPNFEAATDLGANNTYVVDVTVTDGTATVTQTVTVTVTNVNEAPSGTDSTVTMLEGQTRTFTASDFGFSDPDAGDTLDAIQVETPLPTGGVLRLNGVTVNSVTLVTRAQLDADLLRFEPAANANGAAYTTLNFTVSDGEVFGAGIRTLTIDVTAVNDAPQGANNTVTIDPGPNYTFSAGDFGFSDTTDSTVDAPSGNALVGVIIKSLPAATDGTLTFGGLEVVVDQEISAAALASLLFIPADPNVSGAFGTFTFALRDNGGTANAGINTSSTYTFAFQFPAVNQPTDITSTAPTSAIVNQLYTYAATATDPDSTLTWSVGLDNTCGGAGATINASTGVYEMTHSVAGVTCIVSVKVCDNGANTGNCVTQNTDVFVAPPPP